MPYPQVGSAVSSFSRCHFVNWLTKVTNCGSFKPGDGSLVYSGLELFKTEDDVICHSPDISSSSNLSSSNSITTRHYSSKPWYCPRCSFAWYCPRCSFACDFSSRFSLFFWFSSSTQVFASNPKFRLTSNTLCMIIDFQEKPSKPLSMV